MLKIFEFKNYYKLLILIIIIFITLSLSKTALAYDRSDCVPFIKKKVEVKKTGQYMSQFVGEMASFNPCHSSVSFQPPSINSPRLGEKPPVVILIHGGSGLENYQRDAASVWRKEGFATLIFDAFEMNGLDSKSNLVRYGTESDSKQKLIFTVSMTAYKWLLKNKEIDSSRLYFQGLSQGGNVAINIAGIDDSKSIKAVIAEGAPSYGIGFPNKIKVPLMILYGENDIYGTEGIPMYKIKGPCRWGSYFSMAPEGTGKNCNRTNSAYHDLTISPQEWFDKIKLQNQNVTMNFARGGGHGVLFGEYKERKDNRGGRVFYSTSGAPRETREKTWSDLKQFFKSKL